VGIFVSALEGEPATPIVHEWSVGRLVDGAVYGLFGIYLVLVTVSHATDSIAAWHLAVYSVVLGTILGCRLAADTFQEVEQLQSAVLSILGIMFVVIGIIYQSSTPGLGLGPNRPLAISVVLLATIFFFFVVTDARRYTRGQWLMVACFVTLATVYFSHTLAFDPSSSQSRWPIWAAVVMGANLFVIPRLVPERIFFWFLARLAALVVLIGLVTYVVGEYSLWIFEVQQWSSNPSVPGYETDVSTIQSIFPNPNSFGLLSFAGFVAAIVELHRSIDARRPLGAAVAVALAALCGAGVFLSNARAAMLAAAVAGAIYTVYAIGGRLTVPVMAISSVVGVFGLLMGMYVGLLDISASGRFELWTASVQAIRDGPLLFGHGSGPASPVIEPYLEGTAASPHNAYLVALIQVGVVGTVAYLGLIAGSIFRGILDYQNVNVAMLALATGWAVHHMFESDIMFRWSLGAILAALAFGYLIVGTE
jgi:O-antigen ligase